MTKRTLILSGLSLLVALAMILSACVPAATPPPTAAETEPRLLRKQKRPPLKK